jgi:hypothetical protein
MNSFYAIRKEIRKDAKSGKEVMHLLALNSSNATYKLSCNLRLLVQ